MSLQLHTWVKVSLVRGKEVWRIIDAESIIQTPLRKSKHISRIAQLVARMTVFDEPVPDIYDELYLYMHSPVDTSLYGYATLKMAARVLDIGGLLTHVSTGAKDAIVSPYETDLKRVRMHVHELIPAVKNGMRHIQ